MERERQQNDRLDVISSTSRKGGLSCSKTAPFFSQEKDAAEIEEIFSVLVSSNRFLLHLTASEFPTLHLPPSAPSSRGVCATCSFSAFRCVSTVQQRLSLPFAAFPRCRFFARAVFFCARSFRWLTNADVVTADLQKKYASGSGDHRR